MKLPYYLTITPFFPNKDSFRAPFIYDQVIAIEKSGKFNVIVLMPKPWYLKIEDYEFEGVKVYFFSTFDLPSAILPGVFDKITIKNFLKKLKKISIQISDIQVAHSHVSQSAFLANALKKINPSIKAVLQHHGFDVLGITNGKFSKFKWHQKWVENYGIKQCNKIDLHICVSQKTLEKLQKYSEINIKEAYILYNGVDTSKFFPIKGLKNESQFVIGCVGNFWEIKDQITLIKSLELLITKSIKNIKLIFIGNGYNLNFCKNYVIKNNLTQYVEFILEIPHRELNYFYNSLNLFVLPSYYEAFGCVYTEASACNIPFIGVNNQGIAEIISSKNTEKQLIDKSDFHQLSYLIEQYYLKNYTFTDVKISLDINFLIDKYINHIINKK